MENYISACTYVEVMIFDHVIYLSYKVKPTPVPQGENTQFADEVTVYN
jgi:hypothetical protein